MHKVVSVCGGAEFVSFFIETKSFHFHRIFKETKSATMNIFRKIFFSF